MTAYLKLAKHEVEEFDSAARVKEAVLKDEPDLLLLEAQFPDGDGFALVKDIRSQMNTPVMFLTSRGSESDRITGLELGADDYLVKPFSAKEAVLRITALLRRISREETPREIRHWQFLDMDLVVDETAHRAVLNGSSLRLTAAEWRILTYLASNLGTVVSREQILNSCLEYSFEGYDRTVDTHIKNLRSKLGNPLWIETVRGYGYRFNGNS